MNTIDTTKIEAAEVVIPCNELQQTLDFFTEKLGFQLLSIFPADDPSVAVLAAYGVRLRLLRDYKEGIGTIRLLCRGLGKSVNLIAPNGTKIELVDASPPLVLPPLEPAFLVSKVSDGAPWITGRAGMRYRDLLPGRLGGRFIASHIKIEEGGPVPDYVHFHKLRLQMIYCYKGWVKVVYEDQGEPFVMSEGDCVLQPPEIRHRVLEASSGLEVIELSSPAHHETLADYTTLLPTGKIQANREFSGQQFVRHQAEIATWQAWRQPGFEARDIGIAAATNQVASACVVRKTGPSVSQPLAHQGELLFVFVLSGELSVRVEGGEKHLLTGDCFVIPANFSYSLDGTNDLSFFEVRTQS